MEMCSEHISRKYLPRFVCLCVHRLNIHLLNFFFVNLKMVQPIERKLWGEYEPEEDGTLQLIYLSHSCIIIHIG